MCLSFCVDSFKLLSVFDSYIQLEYDMPNCKCSQYLLCLVFSELPGSVIWYLSLSSENSQSLLLQVFCCCCLLILLLLFLLHINSIFYDFSKSFGYSILFLSSLIFNLRISIDIYLSSLILSSAMFSLLMMPSKVFFTSFTVFFKFLAFHFYSSLEFTSLCLYHPFAFACYPLFPLDPL